MIKLLLIGLEYPPIVGGGGTYVDNLLSELVHEDMEIIHLTIGSEDSAVQIKDNFTQIRSKALQEIYLWEGNIIDGMNVIINVIRDHSPNIVHTNHSIDALLFEIINHRFGIPHIVTNHRTPEHRKIISITKARTCAYDFVNKNNDKIYIAPSRVFKNEISFTIEGGQNADIYTIYPGIDRKKYIRSPDSDIISFRNKLGIKKDDFVILLPIKMRRRKGLHFALDCFKYSLQFYDNIKVIISGLPSNEEERAIYNYIYSEIGSNIIEHEYFSTDTMPLLFSSADLTFLPSEAEGLGLALLEAASCGCPIIGSDVIGINEVIQNGYNGLLVEYGNTKLFHSYLSELLKKNLLTEKMIINGYKVLDTKFSLKNQAKKHYEVYRKVIGDDSKVIMNFILRLIEGKIYIYSTSKEKFTIMQRILNYTKTIREESIELIDLEFNNQLEVYNPTINLGVFNKRRSNHIDKIYAMGYVISSKDSIAIDSAKVITGCRFPIDDALCQIPKKIAKELKKYLKFVIS